VNEGPAETREENGNARRASCAPYAVKIMKGSGVVKALWGDSAGGFTIMARPAVVRNECGVWAA